MKVSSSLASTVLATSLIALSCVLVHSEGALAASSSTSDANAKDPSALLQSMSQAVRELNYEGTFVHVQGMHVTAMHILHSVDEHGELERLNSLDGEAREVIRNNMLVTCIWPASQEVVVSKSKPRELLPQVAADLANNPRYEFTLGQADRVAGLPAHVVNVQPTDSYRYGYRFWIDRETNMVLRFMLLDEQQKSVEQIMFTHIEYPASIDASRFDVSITDQQVSWLESGKAKATSGLPKLLADQMDRVNFQGLPPGYREVSETYSPMLGNDRPVSHVMLSDGMASVSVYVEYSAVAEQSLSAVGLSTMGAMNAFGLSTETAFVTAVGEVPAATVRAIAFATQLHE